MNQSRVVKPIVIIYVAIALFFMGVVLVPSISGEGEKALVIDPTGYLPTPQQVMDAKAPHDDPRSWLDAFPLKKILPPEVKARIFQDPEKGRKVWEELVGFRSPDVVGKIAPEIKPGKYTYQDLEKYPGFKELISPVLYELIKPGEPPFGCNIPEFEIVPTQQYFWSLPVAEATKQNMGKAKLDDKGYMIWETLQPGYPFPRPSGPFKAQQYMYNHQERYQFWGRNEYIVHAYVGVNKNLKQDLGLNYSMKEMRYANRILFPPYGWYDEEAEKRQERYALTYAASAPRDVAGTVISTRFYRPNEKPDETLMYLSSLRRFRKISGTDSQDPALGSDQIIDDTWLFAQKLSPAIYPYKYEVLAEREYLVPIIVDGKEYIDSKNGWVHRNTKMMRRPLVAIQLTQQDPNYIYGKRVIYFDRETFTIWEINNYNQKGQLYRSSHAFNHFDPETASHGSTIWDFTIRDWIDKHGSCGMLFTYPWPWNREDVSIQEMVKMGK